jgi:hypothetical protein
VEDDGPADDGASEVEEGVAILEHADKESKVSLSLAPASLDGCVVEVNMARSNGDGAQESAAVDGRATADGLSHGSAQVADDATAFTLRGCDSLLERVGGSVEIEGTVEQRATSAMRQMRFFRAKQHNQPAFRSSFGF